ncbi:hypothetical protein HY249_00455 [Candidatus Azambacteria bacterium]|nr:hypothetical protein [Candidatus Azambacteria bacterium]
MAAYQATKILNKFRESESGQLLLEILIAVSILAFIAIAISQVLGVSFQSSKVGGQRTVALGVAQEEMEAVRAIAKESWNNIYGVGKGVANKYHISNSAADCGTQRWCLVAGQSSETFNGLLYTKYIYIDNVSRTGGDIDSTYSAPNDDPLTQKVSVAVSWQGGSIDIYEYFTRARNSSAGQTNWTTSGQATNPTSGETASFNSAYSSDDGNIDTATAGSIKLK